MSLDQTTADDPLALTVLEFCVRHRLSRSQLYKLWRQGRGPRCMEVGTKRLISVEAAAKWRREREKDARPARKPRSKKQESKKAAK